MANANAVAVIIELLGDRGNVVRYTWDGTGTDPNFDTNGLSEGDWLTIDSDNFDDRNNGTFKILRATDDYFEIENSDGIGESDLTLGSTTALSIKFCKVTHTLPGSSERSIAQEQGATHLRIYRTDHAETQEIAEGLQHRFLVDVPIYGSNFETTYVDTTTRGTLEGETNYLTTTLYTDPPDGRYMAWAHNSLWIAGDPDYPGRAWYSEEPGEDGGTSYAQQYPQKYASMFNIRDKWVDFEPDDAQVDTGFAVLIDDLYFFKERKIFMLRNASPDQKPECVSRDIGCVFPNTIVVGTFPGYGEMVFFISQKGPAIIRPGGMVELLPDFTIEELWPGGELLNRTTGELMNEYTRERVYSIIHENTIILLYGDSEDDSAYNLLTTNMNFGYYRSPDLKFKGPLQITFEDFTEEYS